MGYGIRITDSSANELLITPDILTLYEGGREEMPSSGTNGQTYQKNIDIIESGQDNYDEENVSVLTNSFIANVDVTLYNLNYYDDVWYQSWFANNSYSFFERNESTGILTTWTPNKSAATSYDGLLSVFPISFWDKRGASSFSSINIFAGTCYLVYDQSATSHKTVYSVGTQGVENIDYVIFLRHYQGDSE